MGRVIDDYPEDVADQIVVARFGRGSWVERTRDGYVVARYRRELNEVFRPAGACSRKVMGEGRTRREAIEDGTRRAVAEKSSLPEAAGRLPARAHHVEASAAASHRGR